MRTIKDKELNYLSQNPIWNLPALIQAIKEEAEEIKKRVQVEPKRKVRLFKDKIGYFRF